MRNKKRIAIAVVGALAALASSMALGITIDNRAGEALALGADPMLALESNRSGIVERLVSEYRVALVANGIAESAFRHALALLRIDQLLAASLVNTLQQVSSIVAAAPADSGVLSRYVAVAPTRNVAALPAADAYLVRSGEGLSVVRAAQLQLTADTQLVGYFVAPITANLSVALTPKDGPGSGANSWIGYTAGNNVASGSGSAVAAGTFNAATSTNASVFAGQSNVASGISSLVIGGFDNRATVVDSLVVAGAGNRATGARSVVVGGGYNLASGQWSFIGGGGRITGSGPAGSALDDHVASGDLSTIAGGRGNRASGVASTIAGGSVNAAIGPISTVAGGGSNTASGFGSSVAGGSGNTASGSHSFIAGEDNTASGSHSFVAGGLNNTASGFASFAAGRSAQANATGCFVWADFSTPNTVSCNADNRFVVRSLGGIFMFTGGSTQATYTGAALQPGALAWTAGSDRAGKDHLRPVDTKAVLRKVAAMPITTWNWKSQDASIRHMGPMAQDFHAAFGLGETPKGISSIDADGVALAAVQGLYLLVKEKTAETALLRKRVAALEAEIGTIAATQLQLQDMAQLVSKLQREVALLRPAREVAMAPR